MLPSYFKIKILVKCREYSTLGLKGLLEYEGKYLEMYLNTLQKYLNTVIKYILRNVFKYSD